MKILNIFLLIVLFANCTRTYEEKTDLSDKEIKQQQMINLLEKAAWEKNISLIMELLENGLDPNTILYNGYSLLFWSGKNSEDELVKYLINKGADVNYVTPDGGRIFDIGLSRLSDETIFFLMDHGVDLSLTEHTGENYFWYALLHRRVEVMRRMLDYDILVSGIINRKQLGVEFIYYWTEGIEEIIEGLTTKGYKIEETRGVLQQAIRAANYDAVKLLLEHGVSPVEEYYDALDLESINGTPLELAKKNLDLMYSNIKKSSNDITEESSQIINAEKIINLLEEKTRDENSK
jgi:ankyrin repeat protein